jgi:hypothetical protein
MRVRGREGLLPCCYFIDFTPIFTSNQGHDPILEKPDFSNRHNIP